MLGIALVTLIMVVSSLGLLAALGAPAAAAEGATVASSASAAAGSTLHVTSSGSTTSLTTAPGMPSNLNPSGLTVAENPVAEKALAQAAAAGVPSRFVFVPRAPATPAQEALAHAQGHVTPLYGEDAPAPLGLAYYGLSAAPNGSVVSTTLDTPGVRATFDPNATGLWSVYPFSSSTDAYGVQLNAVTTSINLLGNSSYEFWTQNVAEFYPYTGQLYLVTNVWNFTGPSLSANAIYSHGPYGQQVGTTFYYSEIELTGVSYPFDMSLYMNNTVTSGRNNVSFTVGLTDHGVYTSLPYDWVDFNSTGAALSQYSANGSAYNPFGLTNDFEETIGGPGGGSQSDLYAADATLGLAYWNTSSSAYQSVPAAFSYGGETGETSTGAYVGWETNTTTGQPYGVSVTGPGFLQGLWNATGAEGLTKVTINVTPTNGFYFIAPNWTSTCWSYSPGSFPACFSYRDNISWAPQEMGNVFYLAPGNYTFEVVLADYDAAGSNLVVGSSPVTISGTLTQNTALGIYTPIYIWENSQFAAMSTGGAGTSTDPYQLINTQTYAFGSIFGLFNDYTFPVYNSLAFWFTTDYVVLNHMPAMETSMPYINLPSTNDLGYLLYNTSNVALVNSSEISGWYTSYLSYGFADVGLPFYGNFYGTFSVELWNATNTLIANDTFLTQTAGLAIAGSQIPGANVVWGNTFTMIAPPSFSAAGGALNLSLGLQESEQGDLIYNNIFDTTITAVSAPVNLYSGAVDITLQNTWNITPTPAATINYAPGFAWFPLTGTIIGNATQGGNYWWDYGTTANPVGVLPYDEFSTYFGYPQIYNGGDYYPLVPSLYLVEFSESGLTAGTAWSVDFGGTTLSSIGTTIETNVSNGSYAYSVPSVGGLVPSPAGGTVTVAGATISVSIVFAPPPTYAVTFTESGLPSGTQWTVTVGTSPYTSTTTTIVVSLQNGSYSYSVATVQGYAPTPSGGSIDVAGVAQGVSITFAAPTLYTVTFTESGLPTGTSWSVTFNGVTTPSTTTTVQFQAADGSYLYQVGSVTGYNSNPSSGTLIVNGNTPQGITFTPSGPTLYTVTFTETGLPSGTSWSVVLGGVTNSSVGSTITFSVANDSYTYTITAVTGYTFTASVSSPIVVSGANVGVDVTFSAVPATYTITFSESGLASGTTWSVTLGGSTKSAAAGATITFTEPNGPYAFTIGSVSGYTSSSSVASPLTVSGANVAVTVTYSATSTTSSGSSGLSTLDWALIGVIIAIVVIGLIVALARRGKGGSSSTSSNQETPSEETSSGDGSSGGSS